MKTASFRGAVKAVRDIGKYGFHPEIEQSLRPLRIVNGIGQQRIARSADFRQHGRPKPLLVRMDCHAAQSPGNITPVLWNAAEQDAARDLWGPIPRRGKGAVLKARYQ